MSLDHRRYQAGDDPDWDRLRGLVRENLGLNDASLYRAREGQSFEDVFHDVIIDLRTGDMSISRSEQDLVYLLSESVKRKWATLTRRSVRRGKIINKIEPDAVPDIEQKISHQQQLLLVRSAVEADLEARLLLAACAKGVPFKDNETLSVVLRLPKNRIENAKKRLIRAAQHVAETSSVDIPIDASTARKGGKS
ncbi:hypothetical protein [Yoonia sp. BS5-3]|uniref:Sigma-70 family RNA polymerase sigma factor n=1 Tax=Yoonia phaeophyticola TaxID=3137369 RepID=A0ABZ2V9A6_9RHOB